MLHMVGSGKYKPDRVTNVSLEPEPWVTDVQVAEHLNVTRMSVYRWVKSLGLPSHKLGRSRRFKISEVDAWVRARCTSPAPVEAAS